jgi:hypothetical protein
MYVVKVFFTDLQDNNHAYNVGDTFPRGGMAVTPDRIKELSGTQNKRGIALIEEVRGAEETAQPEEAAPVENEPRKRTRKRKTEE